MTIKGFGSMDGETDLYRKDASIEQDLKSCKTCMFFCDRSDETPPLIGYCGNETSKKYTLDVENTDCCEEYSEFK